MKNSDPVAVVVLAAGFGKRMNSLLPKVMIEADGKPIIDYVVEASLALNAEKTVVVTGYQREVVEKHLSARFADAFKGGNLSFAVQAEQKGTGDATKSALPNLAGFKGAVVIICGDVPLIAVKTLETLLDVHRSESATVTLLSVRTLYPAQYGRIVRGDKSEIQGIREFKDCTPQEKLINEINSGIYVVDSAFLPGALEQLQPNNAQGEYYLTDIVEKAAKEGQSVACLEHFDLSEVQGVNNRIDLLESAQLLRRRRLTALVEAGVVLRDFVSIEISPESTIAPGAVIGAHTVIAGKSVIEAGAVVDGFSFIQDSTVAAGAQIHQFSHLESAVVGPRSSVGPFARLRPGTVLDGDNKVGNFVETKKAHLGAGAKASHLTYLGDCTVGERSNIGAGTITCNYNGYEKFVTTIGADAFVGSNSILISPVHIGNGSYVGAGSVITKDVEADALGISRAEQKVISGWAAKKRKNAPKK